MVEGLLEALPMEITIIDSDDRIVAWNERAPRLFERKEEIMGRDVRTCHNDESNRMIDRILSEMKVGERDVFRFWYDHEMKDEGQTEKILIEYIALRDDEGGYIGCMETMQRIGGIQELRGERRSLE
jgi:PAS domain S-box-containing protein